MLNEISNFVVNNILIWSRSRAQIYALVFNFDIKTFEFFNGPSDKDTSYMVIPKLNFKQFFFIWDHLEIR